MKSKILTLYTFSLLLGVSTTPSLASYNAPLEYEAPNTNKPSLPQKEVTKELLSLEEIRKNFINEEITLEERFTTYNPTSLFEQLIEVIKVFQPSSQGGKKLKALEKEALKNEFYASRLQIGIWCFAFHYFMTGNMVIPEGKEFFDALLDVTKPTPSSSLPQGKQKKGTIPKKVQEKKSTFGHPIPGTNGDQRKKILEPLYEYLSKAQQILDEEKFQPYTKEFVSSIEQILPAFFTKQSQEIRQEFEFFQKQVVNSTNGINSNSLSFIFSPKKLENSVQENTSLLDTAVKFRTPMAKMFARRKGIMFHESNQILKAQEWYQNAISLGDIKALHNLGSLVEKEDPAWAQSLYTQAMTKGFSYSMDNLADLLYRQGKIEDAKKLYKETANQNNIKAMYNLAIIARDEGNSQEAREWYQKAAEKGHIESCHMIGVFLMEEDQLDKAKEWFEKAALKKFPPSMYNFGILLQDEGHLDKAKEWFEKAVEHQYMKPLNNLGSIECSKGNYEIAEKYFIQAASEGSSEAIMNMGCIKQALGQFDEAESFYKQVLETPNKLLVMQNLAVLENIKENIDASRKLFQQILEEEKLPQVLYLLASLELKAGNFDRLEKLATEVLNTGEVKGLLLLALAHWGKKDFQQAKNFYQKAIASNVEDAEVFYIEFLEGIGELEQAQKVEDHYLETLLPEEIILEEKTVEALAPQPNIPQPNTSPSVQEQLYQPLPTPVESFKAPTPSKKYLKYLERAQKRLEEERKKPVMTQENAPQPSKTYQDVSITLHPDIDMNTLTDFEKIMIQKCLTSLANGEHKRSRYEPLTGYDNLHSMRLTHEDRLVFRILEGSIHQGVTKIQIMSIKGHYEKDSHKAFKNLVTSEVSFIPWSWIE